MIFGVGIDVIEVSRIRDKVSKRGAAFKTRIFTKKEISYCESLASRYQNYAARFAAKEAFFKALGTGWSKGFAWTDVEVTRDSDGKPQILLQGKTKKFVEKKKITRIHASLSHVRDTATAIVILEK